MPYGRWPDRVKAFRRWAADRVDKAKVTDSVTGSSRSSIRRTRGRKMRRRRRKKYDG